MAINTKTIKRRIKSVGNTKKITKAMEMISAVKMRRAVANVLATRNYANLAWELLIELSKRTNTSTHPLLIQRPIKKIGMVVVTSNRGLAGGFNSKLLQEAHKYLVNLKKEKNIEAEIILLGKRGKKIYHTFGHKVVAEFEKIDVSSKIEEILPLANMIVKDYKDGKYDQIVLAYTDFVSAIKQFPHIKQLLPLPTVADENLGMSDSVKNKEISAVKYFEKLEYLFEPSPDQVLEIILPRLVEMQIYQAVLESDASEHSARMMSMRNATDAASDLIKELNYTYNKARQSAITQEIAEIVGGAAALE